MEKCVTNCTTVINSLLSKQSNNQQGKWLVVAAIAVKTRLTAPKALT